MKKTTVSIVVALGLFGCATKSVKVENQKYAYVPTAEMQTEIDQRKTCIDEFLASEYGQWVMNSDSDPNLNQIANISNIPKTCTTDQEEENLKKYLFAERILPRYADGFEKIKISTQRLSAIVKKF